MEAAIKFCLVGQLTKFCQNVGQNLFRSHLPSPCKSSWLIEKNIHILSYQAAIHTTQEGDFTYRKHTISSEIHTNTFHSILYLSPLSPYPLWGRLLVSHINLVSVRACFQRPGSEGTIAANPEAISFHPDRLDLCITAALTFIVLSLHLSALPDSTLPVLCFNRGVHQAAIRAALTQPHSRGRW